jgi:hypothetical protein
MDRDQPAAPDHCGLTTVGLRVYTVLTLALGFASGLLIGLGMHR